MTSVLVYKSTLPFEERFLLIVMVTDIWSLGFELIQMGLLCSQEQDVLLQAVTVFLEHLAPTKATRVRIPVMLAWFLIDDVVPGHFCFPMGTEGP
jgi:hypothetical protein